MKHLCTIIAAIVLTTLTCAPALADLGQVKRYILRDCDKAELAFAELPRSDRAELLRYLGEVFRLKLAAVFQAPLVAGNLADPADIWRSLSGESEVEAKICALRLARKIGPDALDSLAGAVPLLGNALVAVPVKLTILETILALVAQTKVGLRVDDFAPLRAALRDAATNGNQPERDVAHTLLVFSLDQSVFKTLQSIAAPAPTIATTPTAQSTKAQKNAKRDLFRKLASASEADRLSALRALDAADLKALEGFRTTAPRSERVAAALAISHLGGTWMLDNATTKSVDCGFVGSFLPLGLPKEEKKREDIARIVARCLSAGHEDFIEQLIATQELLTSPVIAALAAAPAPQTTMNEATKTSATAAISPPIQKAEGKSDVPIPLSEKLRIVFIRLTGSPEAQTKLARELGDRFAVAAEADSAEGAKSVSAIVSPNTK